MDSGIITFLELLIFFSKDERKVSEIMKELQPYAKGDTNFEVADKEKVLEKVKKKYADGKQDFLDGITVEYQDWWFNVRPSNNEPLMRLTIEADTQEILEEKQKELTKLFL
jgi:phosphomannomutase